MKLGNLVAGMAMCATVGMAAAAHATVYDWSFSDPTYSASGTFTTDATNALIVASSGSVSGPALSDTITLYPNATPGLVSTSPDGAWVYDNVNPVDFFGILFTGVTNQFYNVFSNGGGASIGITFADGSTYNRDNAIIGSLNVTAVPEPSTWALTIVGFAGLGAALRSRRRALAALA